jgi:hypothetical protein
LGEAASSRGLRVAVSATSVRKALLEAGLRPEPERARSTRRTFLRQQAASTLACDFLTVETAFLQRHYVLFFISLATDGSSTSPALQARMEAGPPSRPAMSSCTSVRISP